MSSGRSDPPSYKDSPSSPAGAASSAFSFSSSSPLGGGAGGFWDSVFDEFDAENAPEENQEVHHFQFYLMFLHS